MVQYNNVIRARNMSLSFLVGCHWHQNIWSPERHNCLTKVYVDSSLVKTLCKVNKKKSYKLNLNRSETKLRACTNFPYTYPKTNRTFKGPIKSRRRPGLNCVHCWHCRIHIQFIRWTWGVAFLYIPAFASQSGSPEKYIYIRRSGWIGFQFSWKLPRFNLKIDRTFQRVF